MNPVPNIEIRFLPDDALSEKAARKITTNKQGVFHHAFFPSGKYRIELSDAARFITSMKYVLKDAAGAEVVRAEGGLAPFEMKTEHEVELELVLADKSQQESPTQKLAPGKASGQLQELMVHFDAGEMDEVVAAADRLLKDEPNLGTAHYLRGMALGRLNRFEEAEAALRQARVLAPEQPGVEGALGTVLLQRGQALVKSGKDAEAQPLFKESSELLGREVERTPDSAPLLVNYAAALDAAKRREELVQVLERLSALQPENAQYPLRLAALHLEAGRADQAREKLAMAPRSDKMGASLAYNIAAESFNAGKMSQAIEVAQVGLEFNPNLPALHRLLGRAYLAEGKKGEAKEAMKRFLALSPDGPEAAEERKLLEQPRADSFVT